MATPESEEGLEAATDTKGSEPHEDMREEEGGRDSVEEPRLKGLGDGYKR